MTSTPCPCGSVWVYDPQTGDERCPRCWARHPDGDPPLVAGGQGHDAGDVSEIAAGLTALLVIAGLVTAAAVIAWALGWQP